MDDSCEQDDDHRQSSKFPQHVVVSAVIKEEKDVFLCNDVCNNFSLDDHIGHGCRYEQRLFAF